MRRKPLFLAGVAAVALAGALLSPTLSSGQAQSDDPTLSAALAELAAQQTAILANDAKAEASLAVITENLRIARAYVARGGGRGGAR